MPKPKNRKLRSEEDDRKYDVEKAKAEMLRIASENHNAIYLADLYHAIMMHRETFDILFPVGGKDRKELLEALDMNVDRQKLKIRDRLFEINQSAGLIALYKLIGTEDERVALSNIKVEKKQDDGNKDNKIELTIS